MSSCEWPELRRWDCFPQCTQCYFVRPFLHNCFPSRTGCLLIKVSLNLLVANWQDWFFFSNASELNVDYHTHPVRLTRDFGTALARDDHVSTTGLFRGETSPFVPTEESWDMGCWPSPARQSRGAAAFSPDCPHWCFVAPWGCLRNGNGCWLAARVEKCC